MKKSETPISGHVDPAARLTALLGKILNDLGRSIEDLKEASEKSDLPYLYGNDADIELAARYLHDLGLPNDGERLRREYWRLCKRCTDEWLVAMADGESQKFHRDQLIELFGQFPRSEGPSDPTVSDRKVAILGYAVQFSDYLSGLISSVVQSSKTEPPTETDDKPPKKSDDSPPPKYDPNSADWILSETLCKKLNIKASTISEYRKPRKCGRDRIDEFGNWNIDCVGKFRRKVNRKGSVAYYRPALSDAYKAKLTYAESQKNEKS
jgi:hypothetical protein